MPKQIHEVGDKKKLRRAVQTHQDFSRDDYNTLFLPAKGHDYGSLTIGQNAQTFTHAQFPTGAINAMYGSVAVPTYWARGFFKLHVWSSTPSVASQTATITVRVRGHYETNAGGALGTDIIGSKNTDEVFGATANVLTKTTFEPTGGAAVDIYTYDWLSWSVGRTGTSGSDSLAADLDIYGVTIEWAPHVPTA